MIDYESYNKIIGYLDKSDLEKLREYIEKEKKRYYLKNARTALNSYIRNTEFYDYLDENRILLTNTMSLYILNSDEILTQEQRKNKKVMSMSHSPFLLGQLEKYENMQYTSVGAITNPNRSEKLVFNVEGSLGHFFSQQEFNYSRKFLGDDILYRICVDKPVCIAESEKGKGLILGLRKRSIGTNE